jgi:hypothetical protein
MSNVTQEESGASAMDPVVIKLGKRKRKDIRKLGKGRGKLFTRVMETHTRLRAQEGGPGESAPVFVVVKQKKRRNKMRLSTPWW